VYADDASNVQLTVERVQQLIQRDAVTALLGEVASARSRAAGIVANRHGVPMITPSSTNPAVTQVGPFVFRTCVVDDVQARVAARFVVTSLAKKRIALLFASDVIYSTELSRTFAQEAKRLGAEIVLERSFLQTETDFAPHLTAIARSKAEVVYAPTYYNHMIAVARQMKASGLRADRFVGADGWDAEELLREAGVALEGAYFTNHWVVDAPWPASRRFVEGYARRFHHDPSTLAATGHDAALVLADALARASGDSREAVRDAIAQTKNVEGATGTIGIDDARNAAKPMVVVRIQGQKARFHAAIMAE